MNGNVRGWVRAWVRAWVRVFVSGQFSDHKSGDVARRRQTSYGVARLLQMVPLEPCGYSTPNFGATAFCTTKIGDFRASSMSSSLTTWSTYSSKRRPLRKDQLGGTKRRYSFLLTHSAPHSAVRHFLFVELTFNL